MRTRRRIDVSGLPAIGYGPSAPLWWGVTVMMAIEGTMFLLTVASYFYLHLNVNRWPPPPVAPPELLAASLNMALLLLSMLPMYLASKWGHAEQEGKVKLWLFIGIVMGIGSLLLRWQEFHALHCQWNTNAYGSIIWTILGLHLTHLVASTIESLVLWVWILCCGLDDKHRLDLDVNSYYWYFVVLSWLPLYLLVYFAPRVL